MLSLPRSLRVSSRVSMARRNDKANGGPPTVEENCAQDHLYKLDMYRSMGCDGTHLRTVGMLRCKAILFHFWKITEIREGPR